MRRIKYLPESLGIKKCDILFSRRISHAPNPICERWEHSDGHNNFVFLILFSTDGKFVMKIGGHG